MHEEISIPELTEAIARLSAMLGPRQGAVIQLAGGITNRNYRVNFGGDDYVVRLAGKRTDLLGIDRESERIANKTAAGLGLAPRVAALLDSPSCLVTAFVHGHRQSAAELREPDVIETVARDLRAFHDSEVPLPTTFDPFELVERYARIAREHGTDPPAGYEDALERARAVQKAIAGKSEHSPVPCHNDLLPANFLGAERLYLIDWEYAGMGDRYFDLGNLAVNNEFTDADSERLLVAYFGEQPDSRRRATLKLFRFVSDFREAMWGLVQTTLSEVAFDFEGYWRRHFDRLTRAGAHPDFRRWLDEAGSGA